MRTSKATVPGAAANAVASPPAPLSESGFQERLRGSIGSQFDRFAYYRRLCARSNVFLADLLAFIADGAYHRIPGVASSAFKLSKGMIGELNDLTVPGVFQISSSTSGDPSYVYTGPAELAQHHRALRRDLRFPRRRHRLGLRSLAPHPPRPVQEGRLQGRPGRHAHAARPRGERLAL